MWWNDKKEGPGKFVFKGKRQCYEGEWVGGAPKYGVLVDIPAISGVAVRKYPIPVVSLKSAENFQILTYARS